MSLLPKPPTSLGLSASTAAQTAAAGAAGGASQSTVLSLLGAAGKTLLMSKAFLLASLLSVSSILAYEQMDGEGLGAAAPGGRGDSADGGNLATMGGRGGADGDGDGDGSNATDDRWGDVRDGKRTWYPKLGGNRGGGLDGGGGGDDGSGSGGGGNNTDPDPEEPDEPRLLPGPLADFLRNLKGND